MGVNLWVCGMSKGQTSNFAGLEVGAFDLDVVLWEQVDDHVCVLPNQCVEGGELAVLFALVPRRHGELQKQSDQK